MGLVPVANRPTVLGKVTVRAHEPIRGVATSGRHGRSFSLGIADAVTVLAADAAGADAAATVIANAVDLPGHPAIKRVPASDLEPESDLGSRLITSRGRAARRRRGRAGARRGRGGGGADACRRTDHRRGALPGRSGRCGREPRASVRRREVRRTEIRKIVTIVEDVRMEAGRPVDPPIRRVVTAAVLANPFAGRYVEDLSPLIADSVGCSSTLSAIAVGHLEGQARPQLREGRDRRHEG